MPVKIWVIQQKSRLYKIIPDPDPDPGGPKILGTDPEIAKKGWINESAMSLLGSCQYPVEASEAPGIRGRAGRQFWPHPVRPRHGTEPHRQVQYSTAYNDLLTLIACMELIGTSTFVNIF
jgi:hypothetical protein